MDATRWPARALLGVVAVAALAGGWATTSVSADGSATAPVLAAVEAADVVAPQPVAAPARPVVQQASRATRPVSAPAPRRTTRPVAARPAAPADPTCSGPGWQERRGRAALATLRPEARGAQVVFRPGRADVLGLTHYGSGLVEVFVRSCAQQSAALLRHVIAHELGHLHDARSMTAADRAEWMAARGIPAGTRWFGCDRCRDFATPAGDFAEVYAQWLRGTSTNRSELAGDASPAELQRLAARFF